MDHKERQEIIAKAQAYIQRFKDDRAARGTPEAQLHYNAITSLASLSGIGRNQFNAALIGRGQKYVYNTLAKILREKPFPNPPLTRSTAEPLESEGIEQKWPEDKPNNPALPANGSPLLEESSILIPEQLTRDLPKENSSTQSPALPADESPSPEKSPEFIVNASPDNPVKDSSPSPTPPVNDSSLPNIKPIISDLFAIREIRNGHRYSPRIHSKKQHLKILAAEGDKLRIDLYYLTRQKERDKLPKLHDDHPDTNYFDRVGEVLYTIELALYKLSQSSSRPKLEKTIKAIKNLSREIQPEVCDEQFKKINARLLAYQQKLSSEILPQLEDMLDSMSKTSTISP